jgi:putative membrane protein
MTALVKWLTLLLLTALLVLFAVVNRHDLMISLYPLPFELELPVYLFVAFFFLMGFMISWLLMSVRNATDALALRKCRKRIEALENELRGLRLGRASHLQP